MRKKEERKMCNNAFFYVKNNLVKSNVTISVVPCISGTSGKTVTIGEGLIGEFFLPNSEPNTYLEVTPNGLDLTQCYLIVNPILKIPFEVQNTPASKWRIRISPNNLPCDTPTTVNITISDDRP
jgi:hypothetical protein